MLLPCPVLLQLLRAARAIPAPLVPLPAPVAKHPRMSSSPRASSSSSGSDIGLVEEGIIVDGFVLQYCSCGHARITEAVWVEGEVYPRCFECLNAIRASVLPAGDRLVFLALLLLRSGRR